MPRFCNSSASGAASPAVEIRPIRPDDRERWLALMRSMSWATRFKRGARRVEELGEADIERALNPRPTSEIAIVASASAEPASRLIGVARGTRRDADRWDFTIVLLDEWQGMGIGGRLMEELISRLRSAGARCLEGEVLATNRGMLDFVAALGFAVAPAIAGTVVRRVTLELDTQ